MSRLWRVDRAEMSGFEESDDEYDTDIEKYYEFFESDKRSKSVKFSMAVARMRREGRKRPKGQLQGQLTPQNNPQHPVHSNCQLQMMMTMKKTRKPKRRKKTKSVTSLSPSNILPVPLQQSESPGKPEEKPQIEGEVTLKLPPIDPGQQQQQQSKINELIPSDVGNMNRIRRRRNLTAVGKLPLLPLPLPPLQKQTRQKQKTRRKMMNKHCWDGRVAQVSVSQFPPIHSRRRRKEEEQNDSGLDFNQLIPRHLQLPPIQPESDSSSLDELLYLEKTKDFVPCLRCGRRFHPDRLPVHDQVCQKQFQPSWNNTTRVSGATWSQGAFTTKPSKNKFP